jgi:hypothetical protein
MREVPAQDQGIVESRQSWLCPEVADVAGSINVDDHLVEHAISLEIGAMGNATRVRVGLAYQSSKT